MDKTPDAPHDYTPMMTVFTRDHGGFALLLEISVLQLKKMYLIPWGHFGTYLVKVLLHEIVELYYTK